MAQEKNSFLLYCDTIHTVEKLTDEQAGKLFKHLLRYVNDQNPELDDFVLELVFEPIKQQLKRALKRWETIREKRSEAGKKGGRPQKEQAKKANASFDKQKKQTKAKKAVNVNGSVNVNVSVNDNELKNKENYSYTFFQEKWNEILEPQILKLSDKRKEKLKSRINKDADFVKHFEICLNLIKTTPFLSGENKNGWKADFDWLIANDTNYLKVLEGKYGSHKKSEEEKLKEIWDAI